MDAKTVVTAVGDVCLACVEPHPHTNVDTVRPGVCGERALGLDGRACGVSGSAKRDEERVALRVDLPSAVSLEGDAQEPAVLGQNGAVTPSQLLQPAGRPPGAAAEGRGP